MTTPITDERLAKLEGLLQALGPDAANGRWKHNCRKPGDNPAEDAFFAWLVEALNVQPDLIAELRRLKEKYEGAAPRCNAGHVNNLPLALWDCPTCTNETREQNGAFERRAEAAEADMEAAEGYAVELRAALEYMGEQYCPIVCGDRNGDHAPECRKAYTALRLTPAAARQLQKARRAVVEAAKEWRTGEQPVAHAFALQAAVDALEKLEAGS
jgi:hypothetical protein